MKYTISTDRTRLVIKADEAERKELREIQECGGDCQCDVSMHDFLEPLTCNSELEWIPEGVTGDLTSAPMLGILGEPTPGAGGILAGRWPDSAGISQGWFQPILERWAFMDYQVRSVLEDLRDKGEAVFVGGPL